MYRFFCKLFCGHVLMLGYLLQASRPDSTSSDLPPEYVPLRRANGPGDPQLVHKPLKRVVDGDRDRERKWSFPLGLLRRKHTV